MIPFDNTPFDFGLFAGFGIIAAIVWFVVTILMVLVAIWIQYSIIWRAVRRGMREFHYGGKSGAAQAPPAP